MKLGVHPIHIDVIGFHESRARAPPIWILGDDKQPALINR
jgi:hypothetical protein